MSKIQSTAFFFVLFFLLTVSVHGSISSSTNFGLGTISWVPGGETNSTNFKLSGLTFGETFDGNQSSTNYGIQYGFDLAGNLGGAPTVAITSPANGSTITHAAGTLTTPVTLNYQATPANTNIQRYWISHDGINWIDNAKNLNYTFPTETDGVYTYSVRLENQNDVNVSTATTTVTITVISSGSSDPSQGSGNESPGGGGGGGAGAGTGFSSLGQTVQQVQQTVGETIANAGQAISQIATGTPIEIIAIPFIGALLGIFLIFVSTKKNKQGATA